MNHTPQAHPQDTLVPLGWHEQAREALKQTRRPLLLVGPPGSGKSTFAHAAAYEATGRGPEVIHGNPQTEERHIWSDRTLDPQQGLRWVDGPLPRSLKRGRWLLIEEVNQIPPEILGQLLQLRLDSYQQHTIINLATGERIPVPERWRVILTANPQSLRCFSSPRTAAVRALLDGCLVLEVPAMNRFQLEQLLQQQFGHAAEAQEAIQRALHLWEKLEEARRSHQGVPAPSLRAVAEAVRLQLAGVDWQQAAQMALVGKYILDEDLYQSVQLEMSLGEDEEEEEEDWDAGEEEDWDEEDDEDWDEEEDA